MVKSGEVGKSDEVGDLEPIVNHLIWNEEEYAGWLVNLLGLILANWLEIMIASLGIYPLVNVYITNWKITMLLMGKSTINCNFQ